MASFTKEEGYTNLMAMLEEYGNRARELYQSKLNEQNKNASYNLFNSISTTTIVNGDEINVIMHLEDYWYYVENGRSAGRFPPVDKIREWIEIKPVLPREINGKLPTTDQLAFLISRSIAENGIPAGNQLAETIEELNAEYLPRLQEALEQDFLLYEWEIQTYIEQNIRV